MDRREETQHDSNEYQKELKKQEQLGSDELEKQYIFENGAKFRVPYRIIKKVTFLDLSKGELRDIDHCTRLQYRLMLKDAVLKATVNFIRRTINITYNPPDADNLKEKISKEELAKFLGEQGVHINPAKVEERDYDYIKEFYTYAFNPARIREHPPYSYTMEQWRKMKPEWEKKQAEYEIKKKAQFKAFQEQYEREVINGEKPEAKPTFVDKVLGRKPKEKEKGKGFWFHGV